MKKIKIAHVIDASSHNVLLADSIRYSDREKFEYTVISLAPVGKLQEQMTALGVSSFSVNFTSKLKLVGVTWKLYRFFRRNRIDIVQTHLLRSGLIGFTAAKMARVPVTIFTGHHSHEVPLYKRRFLTWVDGLCGRGLSKYTIAPSNDMREIFIRYQKVPAKKIRVIPHGFDLGGWRARAGDGQAVRKELGIENKLVFGAVGRLFWVKDFETIIKAFAVLAPKNKDAVLLIVGDGVEKKKLMELANSPGLSQRSLFTGRRTDIAAVMNAFDVFVHSALAESFGMVYIEAMALGKPVISTPVGVAKDIIRDGETGFLFEKGDSTQLAALMLTMIEEKERREKMGANAKRISDDFAVEKTQAECDDFYQESMTKAKGKKR